MKFKSCTAALFYNLPEGNRDVAQLVAHYVRDVGVVRSSRIIPTKTKRGQLISWPLLLLYVIESSLQGEFEHCEDAVVSDPVEVCGRAGPLV